jgi:hypothetical protein
MEAFMNLHTRLAHAVLAASLVVALALCARTARQ